MRTKSKIVSDRDKILQNVDKVYDNLVDFKNRANSDMIVLRDNQIIRIKPQKI